jgi:hypothetical protein
MGLDFAGYELVLGSYFMSFPFVGLDFQNAVLLGAILHI